MRCGLSAVWPLWVCGSVGSQVGNIVSVVLRGSTQNYLDDVERAVEDGTRTGLCCAVLCCAVLCCAVRVLVVLLGTSH